MFDGNIWGNIMGIMFYMLFQLSGIWMINRILAKERFSVVFRCLIGSVAGTLAFQWFPILFAFALGFGIAAHLLGMCLQILVCLVVWRRTQRSEISWSSNPYRKGAQWLRLLKENPCIALMLVTLFFFIYCLFTHTIPVNSDGSMHTGQATYGDMNMHLGFITSIANQKSFPPDYSIFPGTKLAYPFLCDSVSSGLYIWGASLQIAYIFPMLIAVCQAMGGFYCFIKYWFQRSSTAFIAWVMFFLNGGLGFIYFTDMESIARNFNDFYYTPTSLGDMNLRVPQIIANMLLPQRATLFGWAVLFPLLALLLYAIRKKNRKCFIIAGIFAGALPMIHTHSFLALGLVCTMWLLYDCKELFSRGDGKRGTRNFALLAALPVGLAFFSVLQKINEDEDTISQNGMLILGIGAGLLILYILYYLIRVLSGEARKKLLTTWGIFLGIILVLAIPQLFGWTFRQVGEAGFVRGFFNWSNTGDQYIWFYLKNFGLTFALFLPGYIFAKKKNMQVASPLFLIWFVAELVVFQPNEYDNNKLLFIGFAFMCGLAADFVVDIYEKKWTKLLKVPVAVVLVFFGTVSAILTLGREWVSDYELYSDIRVEACRYIEKNTKPDAVILTASNHNNEVAALTGRNIVCGAGTFLYYHGVDYADRENELPLMYGDPVTYKELYKTYGIDYVYVSDTERATYEVNEEGLAEIGICVYSLGDVRIYKVK